MLTQKLIRKQDYLATVDREHAGLQDAAAQAADDKAAAASQVNIPATVLCIQQLF